MSLVECLVCCMLLTFGVFSLQYSALIFIYVILPHNNCMKPELSLLSFCHTLIKVFPSLLLCPLKKLFVMLVHKTWFKETPKSLASGRN